jgi:hypothetical protein
MGEVLLKLSKHVSSTDRKMLEESKQGSMRGVLLSGERPVKERRRNKLSL